jgi:hypothetical protein
MLRNLRKRIQAKRLGTPVKTDRGTYLVPATAYVRADGQVCHEIDAKSIMMAVIADEIGTDDPYSIKREYTRREFVAYVRRTTNDPTQTTKAISPVLPPVYHKEGKIIPFPNNNTRSIDNRMATGVIVTKDSVSETLGVANNVLATQESVVAAAMSAEPTVVMNSEQAENSVGSIVDIQEAKKPTESEIVATIVEEVLATADSDVERAMFREFLDAHPDLAHSAALDNHVRLSLCMHQGRVHARYARYSEQVVCHA